nr:Gmad2 immunoglobulin-like domain-containing protein [Phytoactinopolyspora alkaliphila]
MALPVYFTVDGQVNREWQSVTGTDPLLAAADASLNGTSFDPRYESLWSPVEVISAEVVDGVIEVDLRSPVELDADPELADEAVQQLVYTVTATAAMPLVPEVDGAVPVRILVDGAPADDLFGSVDVSEPVTRADQIDVRYLIDIDSPAYGADVSSPVTVSGVAAVFEGNALWELRRDGEVVDSGITQTEEAFTFSPFSIELGDLEPGTYEITVMEDDVSDGEGPEPRFETKEFTVVAP